MSNGSDIAFAHELLSPFCECCGVSGFEHEGKNPIGRYITECIKPYCDEAYLDRAGNIIAFKRGKARPKSKVMLAAHMDEVGFVIKHINDDGTLLFDGIGISPSAMPCSRVRIGDSGVHGVIGMTPIHLLSKQEREKPVSEDSLFIDIGASGKEEAEKYVAVGDFAVFDNGCVPLSDTRLIGKAIDDRIGCAVLCDIIKETLPYDTYFAFTVREELGTLGASAAVNGVKPDIAVAVEATTASDIPSCEGSDRVCVLGGGTVLPTIDGGTSYDKALGLIARDIAEKAGIKYQNKQKIAGGTDARTFQRASGGVRVLGIALPCRYIHTASCVADAGDVIATKRLATLIAQSFGGIDTDRI